MHKMLSNSIPDNVMYIYIWIWGIIELKKILNTKWIQEFVFIYFCNSSSFRKGDCEFERY